MKRLRRCKSALLAVAVWLSAGCAAPKSESNAPPGESKPHGLAISTVAEPKSSSEPPRVVLVRGEESIVADINMGPFATALWKKIQALIANPDISDFSRLAQVFELKPSASLEAVDWRKPGVQVRDDIRGSGGLIKGGRYGVSGSSETNQQRFLLFEVEFDVNEICLSKLEIQRMYGKGVNSQSTHSPIALNPDQTGYPHGLGIFPPFRGGFRIAASGCASNFSINQSVNDLQ